MPMGFKEIILLRFIPVLVTGVARISPLKSRTWPANTPTSVPLTKGFLFLMSKRKEVSKS